MAEKKEFNGAATVAAWVVLSLVIFLLASLCCGIAIPVAWLVVWYYHLFF